MTENAKDRQEIWRFHLLLFDRQSISSANQHVPNETSREKQRLQSLIQDHGCNNWRLIAQHMETRDQRQIREQRKITPFESRRIQELHRQHGRQWKQIATFFPGFSPIMIRNHWNNLQRKRVNQIRSMRINQQQQALPLFGWNQQQTNIISLLNNQQQQNPPSEIIRRKMSISYLLNPVQQ
ncbi:5015_t:CDS:2 [Scutellospora calospora]|uniref:5015_t:CDS:1 n=1 Tax=Scutellospora calospora TaxID=85575 RepID=A0ACA9K147_9GLOM|nr:5015_t:CDS:2 [Scutellospora calospora]